MTRQAVPPTTAEALLQSLDGLNRFRYRRGSGRYAPHKPLLVLLALAAFQRGQHRLRFRDIEPDIIGLLKAFAPKPKGPLSPDDPFWHLQSDGLWHVHDADQLAKRKGGQPTSAAIRQAIGGFPAPTVALLHANPHLLHIAAERVLHTYFAESLHGDLRSAVNLAAPSDEQIIATPSQWRQVLRTQRRRSPAFRQTVLDAFGHACAVCGLDATLDGLPAGLEAAHVRWHAYGGPDTLDNGLALCALHHGALDRGWIGLDERQRLLVSPRLAGGDAVHQAIGRYAGKALDRAVVSEAHRHWHRAQVFKA